MVVLAKALANLVANVVAGVVGLGMAAWIWGGGSQSLSFNMSNSINRAFSSTREFLGNI